MIGLTAAQARAYEVIRSRLAAGVSPTLDEISADLGISSKGSAHRYLLCLRERGLITFIPGRARSIRLAGEMEGLDQRPTDDLRALRDRVNAILKARAQ